MARDPAVVVPGMHEGCSQHVSSNKGGETSSICERKQILRDLFETTQWSTCVASEQRMYSGADGISKGAAEILCQTFTAIQKQRLDRTPPSLKSRSKKGAPR